MPKKKSFDDFKKDLCLKRGDIFDLSQFELVNYRTPGTVICKRCGHKWLSTPDNLLHRGGCPKCAGVVVKTKDEIIELSKKMHLDDGIDFSLIDYKNASTKMKFICEKHGVFEMNWTHFRRGQGCPMCKGDKIAKQKQYTFDEVIERFINTHGNKYSYPEQPYNGAYQPMVAVCPKHGEFKIIPSKHIAGEGCPKCKSSKLENSMRDFLLNKGVIFEEQKRFPWLGIQSLDFYIPSKKLGIECQGIQHFKPTDFAGRCEKWMNEQFDRVIELDTNKKKLCHENGIKLVYFTNEKFDEFLGDKLFHHMEEIYKNYLVC